MPITINCIYCGQLLREIPDLRGRPDTEGKHLKILTLQSERRFNCINPECPDAGVVILGADPIKGTQPLEETS